MKTPPPPRRGLRPFPSRMPHTPRYDPATHRTGGTMRHTTTLLAAVCLSLAGCSSGSVDTDAKPEAKTATPTASASPEKLEPTWGPKLSAAAGEDSEAVSACNQPSSNACARYIQDIMGVVAGLEAEIKKTGREYPKSLEQIGKMKDAESEYVANGCQGD